MRRSRLWLLPILLAVMAAGGAWFHQQARRGDRELPVYVTGAERMVAGEEIYRRGTDGKPFTYPPFAAVPFAPFLLLPGSWRPAADAWLWFAVNLLVLLAVLRWLHRWAGAGWPGARPPRPWLLWVLVAVLAARHVSSVFENQSHDLLVFGVVAAGCAAWIRGGRRGALLAGAGAGVGAALKATPLLFLELFALRRAWLAALALLAAAALCSLLPDLVFPRQDGGSWLGAWISVNLRGLSVGGTAKAAGAWDAHSVLNQSLSGTLTRLFSAPATEGPFVERGVLLAALPPALLRAVVTAGQLLVVGAIAWGVLRARRAAAHGESWRRHTALGECGLLLCGMVLLSPQSSKAHFCVLLVPAVFCADRALRGRRDPWLWVLLAAAAAAGALTAKGLLGRSLGNHVLGLGAVTWNTVLLLAATVRGLGGAAAAAVPEDGAGGPGQPGGCRISVTSAT